MMIVLDLYSTTVCGALSIYIVLQHAALSFIYCQDGCQAIICIALQCAMLSLFPAKIFACALFSAIHFIANHVSNAFMYDGINTNVVSLYVGGTNQGSNFSIDDADRSNINIFLCHGCNIF